MIETFKRKLSLLLIFAMLITIFPIGEINKVFAAEFEHSDDFYVSKVIIGKTYDSDRNVFGAYILIKGDNLKNSKVALQTASSGIKSLAESQREYNTNKKVQYNLTEEQAKTLGQTLDINGVDIPINEENVPRVESVTRVIRTEETNARLKIVGSNLEKLEEDDIAIQYGKGDLTDFDYADNESTEDNTLEFESQVFKDENGLQNIVVTKTTTTKDKIEFNSKHTNNVDVEINISYLDQFRIIKPLNISDDLAMFPNRGEVGDKVFLKATKLDNYDVFFLKDIDGTDQYSNDNRGKNPTYKSDGEGDLDILTVEVPSSLKLGEYYVVLTNNVGENNPMDSVMSEKILTRKQKKSDGTEEEVYDKFTVIDGANKPRIISVKDNTGDNIGPDSGGYADISGQYLGSLNIDSLKLKEDVEPVTSVESTSNGDILKVKYKLDEASDNIGTYREDKVVKSVEKNIKVIIGNKAGFKEEDKHQIKKNLDIIKVLINSITDAESDPTKDVVAEMETIITDENDNIYIYKDRAELKGGYTFIPSKLTPEIDEKDGIIPDRIQVKKNDMTGKYEVVDDFMISIHGKNFMIHKYEENGETKVRYPIIKIGEILLDKNQDDSKKLKVIDESGNELDGSIGNEIGSKILITIPKGSEVNNIGKAPVEITNPIRNSEDSGLNVIVPDIVEFVTVDANKIPNIEEVTPDVVSEDGEEEITIIGSNFREEVEVYIDGERVKEINRSGDGKNIVFNAPKGNEGVTQLQVINKEGGVAIHRFEYVKTYTDPKIDRFNPSEGNTGTLVTIFGDNFLKPSPSTSADNLKGETGGKSGIYKFIGTIVKLGKRDINDYHYDDKNISPQYYTSSENNKILQLATREDGGKYLKLAKYFNSILLHDEENNNIYTLTKGYGESIILSDGVDNTYTLKLNNSNDIIGDKEGNEGYRIEVKNESITIKGEAGNDINLKLKTLYKIDENNKIVGNKIKSISKGKIEFRVPILNKGDGHYDLTVQNPDTNSDIKKGEEGFYYFTQPQSKPWIDKIKPNKGSTEGEYIIEIEGGDFQDNGKEKSKVFIDGIKIPEDDVTVNVKGDTIIAKVPPYDGDLSKDKGTDRLAVSIVILNPDGSTIGVEEGFTYIVPTSRPEITELKPVEGSASGGEFVEIIGSDFRFYEPYNDDNRNLQHDENEFFNDINGNGKRDDFRILDNEGRVLGYKEKEDVLKELKEARKDKEPNLTDEELNKRVDKDFQDILPKVHFGEKVVKITEFGKRYIKILTSKNEANTVDVYIVNNDAGRSNKLSYTFNQSSPEITNILPGVGSRFGKDDVEISGKGFAKYESINSEGEEQLDILVRFGNITNIDVPREQENSGRIDNGRTTVKLEGGLKVEYNGSDDKVNINVKDRDKNYTGEFSYNGDTKFINLNKLKSNDENYQGYELIKLEIKDRRLLVERGYAPSAELSDDNSKINVLIPSYYQIGVVDVNVINPDGAIAKGEFEYKNPATKPEIINITKNDGQDPKEVQVADDDPILVQSVDYKGGDTITILGKDFRDDAIIKIGNVLTIEQEDIEYTLPNKLKFKMPEIEENLISTYYKVVVINQEDGGTASSDSLKPPIYIQFTSGETSPKVTEVIPDIGSADGGDLVTIIGKDFRDEMEGYEDEDLVVYFGDVKVPDNDIEYIDHKTLKVIVPPNTPGKVEVRVKNPDGTNSNPSGSYTYLSNPTITDIVDPESNKSINTISIEGNETIKIIGSSFVENSRVIFNPQIEKAAGDVSGEIIYIEGEKYVYKSGTEANEVEYIDPQILKVKTPKEKLNAKGVMVINPDGGATYIYENIKYDLPKLLPPLDVDAELVYDRYIKVHWTELSTQKDKLKGYEIYVIIDDETPKYIGTTDMTTYIYEEIEEDREYVFKIKAIGNYSPSELSDKSNPVYTDDFRKPDDDGGMVEDTVINRTGNIANVIIGNNDGDEKTTIDLLTGKLAGTKDVVITIPTEVITGWDTKDITVIGNDFTLNFNPKMFNTYEMEDYEDDLNTGVRFTINRENNNKQSNAITGLSTSYKLEANFYDNQIKRKIQNVDNYNITLEYDRNKAKIRRIKNIQFKKYNEYTDTWETITSQEIGFNSSIETKLNTMGTFKIFGTRR